MKRMFMFFATLWLGIMGASAQGYHYDVNNDGSVNVSDAVAVVNRILGKTNAGDVGGGEAIDLGLPSGTLWSSCNIGASSPEEYGNYYAWGETVAKSEYSENNYQYYKNGSYVDIGSDISGTQYDVATALLGDGWRMPTYADVNELKNNCTSEWTTFNGVYGRKYTSKVNGNSIFLPAAGYRWEGNLFNTGKYGDYWTSTQQPFHFEFNELTGASFSPYTGLSIRPVRSPKPKEIYVDLGLPSGTLWASCNIGASKPEEFGDYFAWGETQGRKGVFTTTTYQYYQNGAYIDIGSDICGTEYDAATAAWGSDWRMPTKEQAKELFANCTVTSSTVNGVKGYLFTSNINGNTIFLPGNGWCNERGYISNSLGRGWYWLGTGVTSNENTAYSFFNYGKSVLDVGTSRYVGYGIRAVCSHVPNPNVIKKEPEAVNLGLPSGTKWASFNIGATKPEEYGDYFAWGEIGTKLDYSEDTYFFYNNNEYTSLGIDISGTKYDVARMKWGGSWVMPTLDDVKELFNNCTREWTTLHGVDGLKFTSKNNGNSIFLPAAGGRWDGDLYDVGTLGDYWSSTQNPDYSGGAYGLNFSSGHATCSYYSRRSYGRSVRPVVRN